MDKTLCPKCGKSLEVPGTPDEPDKHTTESWSEEDMNAVDKYAEMVAKKAKQAFVPAWLWRPWHTSSLRNVDHEK